MQFSYSLAFTGLLASLVTADFTIFHVETIMHYCKAQQGGCVTFPDGTGIQPGPMKSLGTDCISDDNPYASKKDGSSLTGVSEDEEIWWENGMCGSPAPYYCYVDNGAWTCNDGNGQNVASCTQSSFGGDCNYGFELENRYTGQLDCVGPITC